MTVAGLDDTVEAVGLGVVGSAVSTGGSRLPEGEREGDDNGVKTYEKTLATYNATLWRYCDYHIKAGVLVFELSISKSNFRS